MRVGRPDEKFECSQHDRAETPIHRIADAFTDFVELEDRLLNWMGPCSLVNCLMPISVLSNGHTPWR